MELAKTVAMLAAVMKTMNKRSAEAAEISTTMNWLANSF